MAAIYTVRDRFGRIRYYEAKLERKSLGGKVSRKFPTSQEAMAWVKQLIRDCPGTSDCGTWRRITMVDRRRDFKPVGPPLFKALRGSIRANGCTLAEAPDGCRCHTSYHCSHYDACLSLADKARWGGWVTL